MKAGEATREGARVGLPQWLESFARLHERARRRELGVQELATYRAARDELARVVLTAERTALQPDQPARRMLRVARAVQVDLEFHDGRERLVTRSLSAGGFAVLMARPPGIGDEARLALRLPGEGPLEGRACVLSVHITPSHAQVEFVFCELTPEDAERIERFVFDAVLATLRL